MARYMTPYYERPEVPWCVIGKVSWGVVQTIKVPEHRATQYVGKHGWTVLISDSEFPVPVDNAGTMPDITSPQQNPVRVAYAHRSRVETDFWRDEDRE